MAEHGGSGSKGFAKTFSKKVFRTKEKVLQNLGKADKTTDDEFDKFVDDFQKQQNVANKLQKELKNYIAHVKNMANASAALYEVMRDTYEPEWAGYGELITTVEAVNSLWENYLRDLQDRVQNPMNSYLQKFPDVRSKISKRGRKLTDFDSTRHSLDAAVNAKKRDEGKISKAREELTEARHVYKNINEELHRELPVLYESRITVLTSNYSSLFGAEAKFEEESAKLKNELADVTEKLARESSEIFLAAAAAAQPDLDNSELDDFGDLLDIPRSPYGPRHSIQVESLHIPSALALSPRRASAQVEHLYVSPKFSSPSRRASTSVSLSRRSSSASSSSRRGSTSFADAPYYPNSITLAEPRRCSIAVESIDMPACLSGSGAMPLSPRKSLTPMPFDSFSESLRGSLNLEGSGMGGAPALSKLYNIPTPNDANNSSDRSSSKSSPHTPKSRGSGGSQSYPPKAFHDTDDDEDEILALPKSKVTNGSLPREQKSPGPDGKAAKDAGKGGEEAKPMHEAAYEAVDVGAQAGKGVEPVADVQEATYEAVNVGAQLDDGNIGESTDDPEDKGKVKDGSGVYSMAEDTDDIYKVPQSNEPVVKVAKVEGVLYQVLATHAYAGEDYDELTFDAGEIINVFPFDDPEEQDDGWLMGSRVGSSVRGVFPANFTKRM